MTVQLIIILSVVTGLITNATTDDIVLRIKDRYNNLTEKCKDSSGRDKPAFQCSGIMIRGVNDNLQFAWSIKELNKKRDGFSLGYLRRDQVFSFDYQSGFIIFPQLETPRKKNTYKVYCSFPIDGWTDGREGRHGCGKYVGDASGNSDHCYKQNIKSFHSWKSHFNKIINSRNDHFMSRQCGFDMTTKSAAKYFAISLKAKNYIQQHAEEYAFMMNELKMHAWSENKVESLPIEAFFYLIGSASGKELAEKYQKDFFEQSGGEEVPIVGIRLPTAEQHFEVESHKLELE